MTDQTDRKDEVGEFDDVITDLKWLVSLGQRARTSDVAQLHRAISALLAHDSLVKERDELKREVEELRLQLQYPDPEDMPGELAAKYCPFNDPLHFHHDGCPSEWAVEERTKKAEAEVEQLRTLVNDMKFQSANATAYYERAEKAESEAKELREELERSKEKK